MAKKTKFMLGVTLILVGSLLLLARMGVSAAETAWSENFDAIANGKLPAGFMVMEGTWEVKDGKLIGHGPDIATQSRVVFGDSAWTNIEFSATMTYQWAASTTRWTALLYRVQGVGGPPYFLFTVRNDASAQNGLEQAYRTAEPLWVVHIKKPWKAALQNGETHHMRVQVFGSAIRYYLDGELVMESNDLVKELNGKVGLAVNGSTVAFDDVVVKKITAEDVPEMAAAVAALK